MSLGRFLNHAKEFHDLQDPPSESHYSRRDIYSRRERLRKTLATRGFTMKFLEKAIKRSVLYTLRNSDPKYSRKSVSLPPKRAIQSQDKFFHLLDAI